MVLLLVGSIMSLMRFSLQHHRTQEEARRQLEKVVDEVSNKFGPLVQRIDWSADRNTVKLAATGVEVDLWVDPQEVHVTADIPLLSRFLAGPLVSGLKGILQDTFQKQLPGK
jgi:hypothetical protein